MSELIPYRGVLIDADKTFGKTLQYNLIREELAELIVAISRYERGRIGVEEVIGEVADVRILCDQIPISENYEHDYNEHVESKIERLKNRIENEDINE